LPGTTSGRDAPYREKLTEAPPDLAVSRGETIDG